MDVRSFVNNQGPYVPIIVGSSVLMRDLYIDRLLWPVAMVIT